MNGSTEPEMDNDASALLKFYTQRVFSKIMFPEKTNRKPGPSRKNRGG
jgi:hypothetical protein